MLAMIGWTFWMWIGQHCLCISWQVQYNWHCPIFQEQPFVKLALTFAKQFVPKCATQNATVGLFFFEHSKNNPWHQMLYNLSINLLTLHLKMHTSCDITVSPTFCCFNSYIYIFGVWCILPYFLRNILLFIQHETVQFPIQVVSFNNFKCVDVYINRHVYINWC